MDYPCAKFGDFSFSHFSFIVPTESHTQTQRRMIAVPSTWVGNYRRGTILLVCVTYILRQQVKSQGHSEPNVGMYVVIVLLIMPPTCIGGGIIKIKRSVVSVCLSVHRESCLDLTRERKGLGE